MRVDEDAAFRTREAAKSAARDSPNILAWGSADVLLDGLFAAETREPLPGLVSPEPSIDISPGRLSSCKQASFGAGLIGLFLSAETRIGCSAGDHHGGHRRVCSFHPVSATDLVSKGAPACTAPAVVLTVLAVPGFTETPCTVALTIAAVCRAIINSSFVGITHTDILLSWLEMRGPWRSLASRSSLAPSHGSLVTTSARNCGSFSPIPARWWFPNA
jgi:hypothetical protein